MNFEPQKFFIGLMDFFSVLLPSVRFACDGERWRNEKWTGSDANL